MGGRPEQVGGGFDGDDGPHRRDRDRNQGMREGCSGNEQTGFAQEPWWWVVTSLKSRNWFAHKYI